MAKLLEFGEKLGRESDVGRRFEEILQSQQKRQLLSSQAIKGNRETSSGKGQVDAHQQLSNLQKRLAKLSTEVTTTLSKHQHTTSIPSRAAPPPPTPPETPPLWDVKSPKQSDTSILTPKSITAVLDENAQLRSELSAMRQHYEYLSDQKTQIEHKAKEVEAEAHNLVRDKEETVRTMKKATDELRAALAQESTSKAREETEIEFLKQQLEVSQLEAQEAKDTADQLRQQLESKQTSKVASIPTPGKRSVSPGSAEVPPIPHLQGWSRSTAVSTPPPVLSSPSEKKSPSHSPPRGAARPQLPTPSPPKETVCMSQVKTPRQLVTNMKSPVSDLEHREAEEFHESTPAQQSPPIVNNSTTREPSQDGRQSSISSSGWNERVAVAPAVTKKPGNSEVKQRQHQHQHQHSDIHSGGVSDEKRPSRLTQNRNQSHTGSGNYKRQQSDSLSSAVERRPNTPTRPMTRKQQSRSHSNGPSKQRVPTSDLSTHTQRPTPMTNRSRNRSYSATRRTGYRRSTSRKKQPPQDSTKYHSSDESEYNEKAPLITNREPKRSGGKLAWDTIGNEGYESSTDSELTTLKPYSKRMRRRRSSLKQSVETQTPVRKPTTVVQERKSNLTPQHTFGRGDRIPISNQVPLRQPPPQTYQTPVRMTSPNGIIQTITSTTDATEQQELQAANRVALDGAVTRVDGVLSSLSHFRNSTTFDIVQCTPQKHHIPQSSFPIIDDSVTSPVVNVSSCSMPRPETSPPRPVQASLPSTLPQNKLQVARDKRILQRDRYSTGTTEGISISQLLDCDSDKSHEHDLELWSIKPSDNVPGNSKSPTAELPDRRPISLIDSQFGTPEHKINNNTTTTTSNNNNNSSFFMDMSSSASPPDRLYGAPPTPLTEGDLQIGITAEDIAKIRSLKDELAEQTEKLKKQAADDEERRVLQSEREEKRSAEKERLWREEMQARRAEEERELARIKESGQEALKTVNETKKQLQELQQQVQNIPNITSVIASSLHGDSDNERSVKSLDESQTNKSNLGSSLVLGKPPVSPKRAPPEHNTGSDDSNHSEHNIESDEHLHTDDECLHEHEHDHDHDHDHVAEEEQEHEIIDHQEQEKEEEVEEVEDEAVDPDQEESPLTVEEMPEEEPVAESTPPTTDIYTNVDPPRPVPESGSKGGKVSKGKGTRSPTPTGMFRSLVGANDRGSGNSIGRERLPPGKGRSPSPGKGRSPSPGKGRGASPSHHPVPGTPTSSNGSEVRRATGRGSPLTLPRPSTPSQKGSRPQSPNNTGFGRVVRPPALGNIRSNTPSDDGSPVRGKGNRGTGATPIGTPLDNLSGKGSARSNLSNGEIGLRSGTPVATPFSGNKGDSIRSNSSIGKGIKGGIRSISPGTTTPRSNSVGGPVGAKGGVRSISPGGRGAGSPVAGKGGVRSNSPGKGSTRSLSPGGRGTGSPVAAPVSTPGKGDIRSPSPGGRGAGAQLATPPGKGSVRSSSPGGRGTGSAPVTIPGKGGVRSSSPAGRGTGSPVAAATTPGKGGIRSLSPGGRGTGSPVAAPITTSGKGGIRSISPGGKGTGPQITPQASLPGKGSPRSMSPGGRGIGLPAGRDSIRSNTSGKGSVPVLSPITLPGRDGSTGSPVAGKSNVNSFGKGTGAPTSSPAVLPGSTRSDSPSGRGTGSPVGKGTNLRSSSIGRGSSAPITTPTFGEGKGSVRSISSAEKGSTPPIGKGPDSRTNSLTRPSIGKGPTVRSNSPSIGPKGISSPITGKGQVPPIAGKLPSTVRSNSSAGTPTTPTNTIPGKGTAAPLGKGIGAQSTPPLSGKGASSVRSNSLGGKGSKGAIPVPGGVPTSSGERGRPALSKQSLISSQLPKGGKGSPSDAVQSAAAAAMRANSPKGPRPGPDSVIRSSSLGSLKGGKTGKPSAKGGKPSTPRSSSQGRGGSLPMSPSTQSINSLGGKGSGQRSSSLGRGNGVRSLTPTGKGGKGTSLPPGLVSPRGIASPLASAGQPAGAKAVSPPARISSPTDTDSAPPSILRMPKRPAPKPQKVIQDDLARNRVTFESPLPSPHRGRGTPVTRPLAGSKGRPAPTR